MADEQPPQPTGAIHSPSFRLSHSLRELPVRVRERRSNGLVLAAVFVSVVFDMAAPDGPVARTIQIVLSGTVLLLAFHMGWQAVRVRRVAAVVVLVAVAVAALDIGETHGFAVTLSRILTAFVVAAAPIAILRGLGGHTEIDFQTVFGVLAVYLLIGQLFATIYSVIADIGSTPFFAGGTDGSNADRLYFSYTTITTVGFGDFTAATHLGRALAVGEALIGQLYLVTVVSVIVGNLGRQRRVRG